MSHPCVGIDLGTTYSCLAVINPAGKPEIVPNVEGERLTRSAVYFQESGPTIVGQLAANAAGSYGDRVVLQIKRHMGDAGWSFNANGRSYAPQEISAMILKKVKQDAEAMLGPIIYAVVTVPAYFDEKRRVATMAAAKLAGLEVLRIINEPTAAAIAYASAGGRPGLVLMYDFGGGTFDVSIVRIKDISNIEVVASEGDHHLGGLDLDDKLASHYSELFSKEKGVVPKDDRATWHDFVVHAEQDKRTLSTMDKVSRVLQWKAHTMSVDVSRQTFEELIGEEIIRTQMLVENALDAAKLKPKDIDQVVLVGGSTRIPAVRQMLRNKFGKEPVRKVNPDEVVALGAAIQAGVLMKEQGLSDLGPEAALQLSKTRIHDVTAHSLGTIAIMEVGGAPRLQNCIVIPKNTPIPATHTESFWTVHDDQTSVECIVTQGEDEDPNFVRTLVRGELPLPPGRKAGRPVEVCYSYDANGRMKFSFKDVESGGLQTLESIDERRDKEKFQHAEAEFDDLEIR